MWYVIKYSDRHIFFGFFWSFHLGSRLSNVCQQAPDRFSHSPI
ncbi:hypothetical protein C4K23_0281 [Pseudomonas chlororaphis]|nr:hypothetical protein C4K23_0281 [Pseudomonas chlororaphis]